MISVHQTVIYRENQSAHVLPPTRGREEKPGGGPTLPPPRLSLIKPGGNMASARGGEWRGVTSGVASGVAIGVARGVEAGVDVRLQETPDLGGSQVATRPDIRSLFLAREAAILITCVNIVHYIQCILTSTPKNTCPVRLVSSHLHYENHSANH